MATATAMPPIPASSGRANRRRSRSSPRSNSRRASRPTTKKKNVISPLFTQWRRSSATPESPRSIDSIVPRASRTTTRRRSPRRVPRRSPPARPPRHRSRCAGTPAAASGRSAPRPFVPRPASPRRSHRCCCSWRSTYPRRRRALNSRPPRRLLRDAPPFLSRLRSEGQGKPRPRRPEPPQAAVRFLTLRPGKGTAPHWKEGWWGCLRYAAERSTRVLKER